MSNFLYCCTSMPSRLMQFGKELGVLHYGLQNFSDVPDGRVKYIFMFRINAIGDNVYTALYSNSISGRLRLDRGVRVNVFTLENIMRRILREVQHE